MPRVLPGRSAPTTARTVLAPRASPRCRGYSARWDRVSRDHRRRHPFCAWCDQLGLLRFAAVVDHKHPVADGGPMFDPANLWGLCLAHHGTKASMEALARSTGQIASLPLWCDDPEARPAQFRAPPAPEGMAPLD